MSRLVAGKHHELNVQTYFERHQNGNVATKFSLVPGQGRHFVQFNNAWFLVERSRQKSMMDLKSGLPWESLYITTLSRDRELLSKMLEDARANALEKEVGKIVIFTSYGHEWRPFGNPRVRRLIFCTNFLLGQSLLLFLIIIYPRKYCMMSENS